MLPDQNGAFTGASSVTPTQLSADETYKVNNYNFALARVRLRGTPGSVGEAEGVKVFFRVWHTQSADTNWDTNTTYLSSNNTSGDPQWPMAPPDNHTVPFYATQFPNFNDPSNNELGTKGVNNRDIVIQAGNKDDTQWTYFGCFLISTIPTVLSMVSTSQRLSILEPERITVWLLKLRMTELSSSKWETMSLRQTTAVSLPSGIYRSPIPTTQDRGYSSGATVF
jgi:hypothetical protein